MPAPGLSANLRMMARHAHAAWSTSTVRDHEENLEVRRTVLLDGESARNLGDPKDLAAEPRTCFRRPAYERAGLGTGRLAPPHRRLEIWGAEYPEV